MPSRLSAYPNPFSETLSLEVDVDQNVSAIVKIMDGSGKIVKLLSWTLRKGTNKTSLHDLHLLKEGEYFLDIKNMQGETLFSTTLSKS